MQKTYIIAEIGNNHNGSKKKALELIDKSAESNVDAVKFQSFRGIDIISPKIKSSEYPNWNVKNYEYWHEFIDSIALKLEDHQEVIDYTLSKKLDFITTPTSTYIVDFLENLKGIKAYKVASMDLTNIPLLEKIAQTNKKIIMSTGMGDINEIKRAVKIFAKNDLSILHCVSDYPLDPNNANLGNISILMKEFPENKIGFSDHSLGVELAIAARCIGATIIEKHITLNRKDPSPAEHHFALEPDEFSELVKWLRSIDVNINNKEFTRSKEEKVNKDKYRRSYHYKHNLASGNAVTLEDLVLIRPGIGIGHNELNMILGKNLKQKVNAYDACLSTHFEL